MRTPGGEPGRATHSILKRHALNPPSRSAARSPSRAPFASFFLCCFAFVLLSPPAFASLRCALPVRLVAQAGGLDVAPLLATVALLVSGSAVCLPVVGQAAVLARLVVPRHVDVRGLRSPWIFFAATCNSASHHLHEGLGEELGLLLLPSTLPCHGGSGTHNWHFEYFRYQRTSRSLWCDR